MSNKGLKQPEILQQAKAHMSSKRPGEQSVANDVSKPKYVTN
jgi:hypothetical protein